MEWDDWEVIEVLGKLMYLIILLTIWDRSLRSWCVSGARWRRYVERLEVGSPPKKTKVPLCRFDLAKVELDGCRIRCTSQPCMR